MTISVSFQTRVTSRTFSVSWSIFLIKKWRVLQSINNLMHRSKPRSSCVVCSLLMSQIYKFLDHFALLYPLQNEQFCLFSKSCPFRDIKSFDDPFLGKSSASFVHVKGMFQGFYRLGLMLDLSASLQPLLNGRLYLELFYDPFSAWSFSNIIIKEMLKGSQICHFPIFLRGRINQFKEICASAEKRTYITLFA